MRSPKHSPTAPHPSRSRPVKVTVLRMLALFLAILSSGLVLTNAGPASAGLSPGRECREFWTGDHHRRLDVCARVWYNDADLSQARAVVEMHSYILVNGHWMDSTSRSITVKDAGFYSWNQYGGGADGFHFGNNYSANDCRVNGPSSSHIACSVPNTHRVAFYGKASNTNPSVRHYKTCVYEVNWRDDAGVPHVLEVGKPSYPDSMDNFCYGFSR